MPISDLLLPDVLPFPPSPPAGQSAKIQATIRFIRNQTTTRVSSLLRGCVRFITCGGKKLKTTFMTSITIKLLHILLKSMDFFCPDYNFDTKDKLK